MKRIFKILKPYTWAVVLAVGLLFVQAVSDLNLPNLMSDIVNVGIQQSGVEHGAPEVLPTDGYDFLTAFMTDDEKQTVSDAYTLTDPDDLSQSVRDTYPDTADAPVYVLNDPKSADYTTLDAIFGTAEWTFIDYMKDNGSDIGTQIVSIELNNAKTSMTEQLVAQGMPEEQASALAEQQISAQAEQMQETDSSSQTDFDTADMSSDIDNIDLSRLYQFTPYISQLPAEWMDTARTQAEATQDSIRTQTGAVFAGLFYKSLGADLSQMKTAYIVKIGLYMLGLSLLATAAAIGVSYLASRTAAGTARDLRRQLFKKVESFSNTEFNRFSSASLITRSTNDVTQVQTIIVMGLRILCYAPILGIGGVIMALRQSTSMSWIIAVAVLVLLGVVAVFFTAMLPRFRKTQKLVDRLNLVMRENLNGLSVIRAFGNQSFEQKRFETENENVTYNNLFINRGMAFMMPLMMLIMNIVTLVIIWTGAHQIAESTMQVGNMMAFMQYAMQIIMSFLMIAMMFVMVPRAAVSLDRIGEVLDTEPVIRDPESPAQLPADAGALVFDHVDFKYAGADENVLEDVSFTAEPGRTTAFIGATGAGKSTLVNMIPRFYDVSGGQITLNGTDIRDVPLHELRSRIGYVPQKGVLFSGTASSNLRYGNEDATDAEVAEGARIAQALDFITADPEGFDRTIAQGGDNVSGGQKQRLSIARALVRKPQVYIFDDSFSALDFKTDAKLRGALKESTGNAAVLIVAQRINTIMNADQIVVLDEGRVVGRGTHAELLKNCETYREIALSQLSEEELENVG